MQPYFSILMATYNRAHTIEHAIQSLMDQSESSWELVIVDDGSTDDTNEILKKYSDDPRIKIKHMNPNGGVNHARNEGLRIVSGQWVVVLDSDNQLTLDALKYMRESAESFPDGKVFKFLAKNKHGRSVGTHIQKTTVLEYKSVLAEKLSGEYHTMSRSDLITEIMFLKRLSGGEGVTWKLLAKEAGEVIYIPKQTLIYEDEGEDRLSNKGKNFGRLAKVFNRDISELGWEYLKYCPKQFFLKSAKAVFYFFRFHIQRAFKI